MLLLLLLGLISTPSFAKDVTLEWDPIDDAVRYGLEIESHSGEQKKRMMNPKKNKWEGDLPFGVYTYRVHAVDRVDRPGEWSDARPLVVLPNAPRPLFPEDGADVSIFEKSEAKIFKWENVPEAQEYKIVIMKDGAPLFTRTVTGNEAEFRDLGPGEYSWSVQPIIKAPGRAPASLSGREWAGQASKPASFEIAYEKLKEPEAISPIGHAMPGKVRFQWKKVANAKSYEFTLEKEEIEGKKFAPKKFRVATNGLITEVSEMGSYRWKVRAIASVASFEASTSESTASFELGPSDPDGKKGYIGFSTLFAPYKYGIKSPAGTGSLDSSSMTLRLTGERWLNRGWGVGGGIQNTFAKIQGGNYTWMDLEAFAKYCIQLKGAMKGVLFLPKAGLEKREYLFFSPFGTKTASTMGLSFGFDLRKQLAERWSAGMKLSYFKPVTLSGVESGSTIAGASNLSVGVQGFYWRSPTWGFGVGAFFDRRSFGYNSSTAGLQEVNLDSTQFFGSILLRI